MSLHILAFAAALAAPPPASAPMLPPSAAPSARPSVQLHVTGPTTADPKIVGDALQEVQHFAGGHILNCSDVTAVAATPMPRRWVPSDPNFRLGPPGARYERWDVTLCGRVEPFLLVFWKEKSGPAFNVGHPFPAGPARPHR
ncbi:MAG: hypothetical protein QOH04_2636 [Sphingomonadales bacterium]|jgi:hypothetical protein|nr:hypothetical protein [Sphingomonadales bacterium]